MSTPISGTGSPPPPPEFSSEPPVHSAAPPPTTFFDSIDSAFQLNLNVDPTSIHLQPGVSLVELSALISAVVQELKKTLSKAELVDAELARKFYLNISQTAGTAIDALNDALEQTLAWNDPATGAQVTVNEGFNELSGLCEEYNDDVDELASSDREAINKMNDAYEDYENLDPADIDTPEEEQAVRDTLNAAVQEFNDYVSSTADFRVSLQQRLIDLNNQTNTYNTGINSANVTITSLNEARAQRDPPLPPYPLLIPAPSPVISSPLYLTMNNQPAFPAPLDPGDPIDRLQFYTQAVSSKGTEKLRDELKKVVEGEDNEAELNAAIDQAIANAQLSPDATERDFFSKVRIQLASILGAEGFTIFNTAIFNVPVLQMPITSTEEGNIDEPSEPGSVPTLTMGDFMNAQWLPTIIPLLDLITALNKKLEFARALAELEGIFFKNPQRLISYPVAFVEKLSNVFLKEVGGAGTGVGLGSFAIGLQTRNLEEVLSRSIIQAVASQTTFPVSGRLYSRLLFSTLDLLSKSSLLSALPASYALANRLGFIGASSPVIELAISLGFSERIANAINANVVRSLVNGQINQIAFGARFAMQIAQNGVDRAEILLQEAINSGDSITDAANNLVKAELQLAGAKYLLNTFGSASIGRLAQLTEAATASINLSLLTVVLAEFGKSVGLPAIIPQLFANFSGLPTAEILAVMNAGAKIGEVLENPLSLLFLKQTLLDTLVNRGFSSAETAEMINNAINNIVLMGGIHTFSHLKSALFQTFRQEGLGQLEASILSVQAAALVRGDLGIEFLNLAYGLSNNSELIASSVVANILLDTDREDLNNVIAREFGIPNLSETLTGAIDRAVAAGGFETQREFRDALVKELGASNLSLTGAIFLANAAASFGVNGIVVDPFGLNIPSFNLLESSLVDVVIREFSASLEQAKELVQEAIKHALVRAPFFNSSDLKSILREEFVRNAEEMGFSGAHIAFDHALGALAESESILGLPGLIEQLGAAIVGLSREDLGSRLAQELRDSILVALLGGSNVDEIEENKNPLSITNQIHEQISKLTETEDQEQFKAMIRKLIALLEDLLRPNAGIGQLLVSLMENPNTFISNLAMAGAEKRSIDIPV
jgi:post-segregation antitoxin (ccd killing protein)